MLHQGQVLVKAYLAVRPPVRQVPQGIVANVQQKVFAHAKVRDDFQQARRGELEERPTRIALVGNMSARGKQAGVRSESRGSWIEYLDSRLRA